MKQLSQTYRRYQHWSDDEVEYLLNNWWDKSRRKEIAQHLNRPIESVTQKFYAVLREKNMSTKEYYRLYSGGHLKEASVVSHPQTTVAQSAFELFGGGEPSPGSAPQAHTPETSTTRPYQLIELRQHPAYQMETSENKYKRNDVSTPQTPSFVSPAHNGVASPAAEGDEKVDVDNIDFEDFPRLLIRHERKITDIEQKLQGMMTVRQFAAFFADLDAAYAQIEQLQKIIVEQEETIESLQRKLKQERERIKLREDELQRALDAVNARLAEFLEKKPHEKIQVFAQFQEDLRSSVEMAEYIVNKRYAAV